MNGITVWAYKPEEGKAIHQDSNCSYSGIGTTREDDNIAEFVKAIETHGHAITVPYWYWEPWNHRVVGCGVSHRDAEFAENGRSMAAYYENDRQPWWELRDAKYGPYKYYEV